MLIGQGISAIGDAVSVTTMPLLVLALTGSGLQMGIVGVLQRLPDLLFGLPAGAYADRWDRRKMMLWADAARAILTATIPVAWVSSEAASRRRATQPYPIVERKFAAGPTPCLLPG